MKVLITGATGFVGSGLVDKFLKRNFSVNVLTRNVPRAAVKFGDKVDYFKWEPIDEIAPTGAFKNVDAVIHLLGENIAGKRWSEKVKKEVYDSRIIGTENLIEGLVASEQKVKTFVSTSAIGIYGVREDEDISEEEKIIPRDFLSKLCIDWEKAVDENLPAGIRKCIMRVGIVLGRNGGALSKMELPFKCGVGGVVGSGKQMMSWIHVEDLRELYFDAVKKEEFTGVINATAPNPVNNKTFTKSLGKVLSRPTIFPLPSFAAEVALGELSTILLDGQKVLPKRALELGYNYQYPKIDKALEHLYK